MHRALVGSLICVTPAFASSALADADADAHEPFVLPTFSFALGGNDDFTFVHGWLGLSVSSRSRVATFVSAGVELEAGSLAEEGESYCSTSPILRFGVAVREKAAATLPIVQTYGILGLVARHDFGARIGVGVSFPVALPLAEAGIPNMVEGVVDIVDSETVFAVRVGWNL